MPQHPGYHTRHASNTFEKDVPDHVLPFGHCVLLNGCFGILLSYGECMVVLISRSEVHASSEHSNRRQRCPIGPCLGFTVCDSDRVHLILGVAIMLIQYLLRVAKDCGKLTSDEPMLQVLF